MTVTAGMALTPTWSCVWSLDQRTPGSASERSLIPPATGPKRQRGVVVAPRAGALGLVSDR